MEPSYTERIRQIAAESPKTQAQLAREVGVTDVAICKFLGGHTGMRSKNLDRVARACGHRIEVVKVKEPVVKVKAKRRLRTRRRIADFGSEA